MKKFLVFLVAVVVTTVTAAVYAGEGCCAGMAKSGAVCSGDMLSKLNLTDAQKAKIETLKADCRKATSTSELHGTFTKGLEKILTPAQLAQWKTMTAKTTSGGGCPFMKSMGAKTDKQT